ncbi:MAG: S41 family peptidase [Bacteroidota bacterium]
MSRFKIYLPIAFALVLVLGLYLGYQLNPGMQAGDQTFRLGNTYSAKNKVSNALDYIKDNYVDSVDVNEIEEELLTSLLSDLDPHSQYIPAKDFNQVNDPLRGNFEGIGVQFRIEDDTVTVISPISGGPSEKVGIRAGDRIVTIEGDTVAGVGISNEDVIKQLKGERGTKVKVGVHRRGVNELLHFTITRDVIPTYSIDIAFMPKDSVGYIKLSKFSATSYEEMKEALQKLSNEGMHKLILDLRGNTGGYLESAINLTDEFLEEEQLIVYTEGNNRPRQYAYASEKGMFQENPIAVLIDEGSASASEILAGAIQDNDRGIVVGRRSFGKGLVQEQKRFDDGSAMRLTVSRYHTPTGRSIQRPYDEGKKEYYHELMERWENGEMTSPDSVHLNDSLVYTTPAGDTVYGGGGIMPDIFVPVSQEQSSEFINQLFREGLFYKFAFDYVDLNRPDFDTYAQPDDFIEDFEVSQSILQKFLAEADEQGIEVPESLSAEERKEVDQLLKALIGRNLFDNEAFYPLYLKTDRIYKEALEALEKNKHN